MHCFGELQNTFKISCKTWSWFLLLWSLPSRNNTENSVCDWHDMGRGYMVLLNINIVSSNCMLIWNTSLLCTETKLIVSTFNCRGGELRFSEFPAAWCGYGCGQTEAEYSGHIANMVLISTYNATSFCSLQWPDSSVAWICMAKLCCCFLTS